MKIQLEKMSNTRDLGGFPTANGIVKPHLLYRSGQLFFATEADLRKLSEEGITQIVDFRSEEERSEKPDPPVEGAKYIHDPALATVAEGITRDRKTERKSFEFITANLLKTPDFAQRYMQKMYADLIGSEFAMAAYRRFLSLVWENDTGATLYHCTAGKDRAGLGTMFLLEIFGAKRDDILEDYLKTNFYLEGEIDRLLVMMTERLPKEEAKAAEKPIRDFFGAREAFLLSAYRAMEERCGSVKGYLKEMLGMDEARTEAFRERFLQ